MPTALTKVRNAFDQSRFAWPELMPMADQHTEPTVNTTKPQPVTRAEMLAAVIIAAMVVAAGAR
jgi:hypothetical protein